MARSPRAQRPVDSMRNFERWPGTYVRLTSIGRPCWSNAVPSRRSAGRPRSWPSRRASRLRQQDRLERLAQPLDVAVVALGQEVVERAVLEVGVQELREPRLWQADLLEQERHLRGAPATLQEDHGRAGRQAERLGDGLARGFARAREQLGPRVEAAQLHLLGEAERRCQVAHDPRGRHERAPAAGPLEALLASEIGERTADGDEAAAVALGELALRRQPVARPPTRRRRCGRAGRDRPGGGTGSVRARAGRVPTGVLVVSGMTVGACRPLGAGTILLIRLYAINPAVSTTGGLSRATIGGAGQRPARHAGGGRAALERLG